MGKAKRFGILVATDGSAEATAAVKATVISPWPRGASVHVVVVRTPLPVADIAGVPAAVFTDLDRGLAAVAESARKILAQRWPDATSLLSTARNAVNRDSTLHRFEMATISPSTPG